MGLLTQPLHGVTLWPPVLIKATMTPISIHEPSSTPQALPLCCTGPHKQAFGRDCRGTLPISHLSQVTSIKSGLRTPRNLSIMPFSWFRKFLYLLFPLHLHTFTIYLGTRPSNHPPAPCSCTYFTHVETPDNVRAQDATQWTASVQSATQWTASVHTSHMPKPVIRLVFEVLRNGLLRYILFVFKVLRNGLLPYILYTCPNLW